MALLAWIPNEKKFLKIQEGTGDNLSNEDIANGYCDYVLWNIFSSGELDADEEWQPEHLDGGILLHHKSKKENQPPNGWRFCFIPTETL